MITKKQIKIYMDAGSDYVRDWVAWGNDPHKFGGQSEAWDMAQGYICGKCISQGAAEGVANYIYEGMLKEVERQKKKFKKKEA